jgi:mRNA interferase HigB
MRVVSKKPLQVFWLSHADSEETLNLWYKDVVQSHWISPNDLKTQYPSASILRNSRVCFNIKGNSYRLIVAINYRTGFVLIKWIGTHAEYDKIDAETVGGL